MAVDTSALMAIALRETEARACMAALGADDDLVISAGTLTEALIVAAGRNVGPQMTELLGSHGFNVVAVTQASAQRIGAVYQRWGKGFHPARLNLGDCFSYDVAQDFGCPLLYVGNDFAKTDIESVL
jgi:ribonuclease VapC